MFQEDVDFAFACERDEALGKSVELGFGVAAGAAQAIAAVRCSLDIGRSEVVTFGNTERGIVLAHEREDFVGEPALVAEFEGQWNVRVPEG